MTSSDDLIIISTGGIVKTVTLTPIEVTEQGHITIPLGYVLQGTELDLVPEVVSGRYVNVRILRDRLDVQATKYIGYIPLNSRYVLHVIPKFNISNLLKLLTESKGDSHALEYFERSYNSVFDPNRTLIDFLASCLCYELDNLGREGMWRTYLPRSSSSSFPAGKILPLHTALHAWVHGHTEKVHFERFEMSKDTIPNRLIKYAIWLLTTSLVEYVGVSRDMVRRLHQHLKRFQDVKLDHTLAFLEPARQIIRVQSFPRTRPYYSHLCQISLYVLHSLGLDLLNTGAETTLPSFVIDLESAFEKYILRSLRRYFDLLDSDIEILDGTSIGKRELFIDRQGYPMTPDIVLLKNGLPVLIVDVKYKVKPERSDRSQVITYAVGYGAMWSMLICPASSGERQGQRLLGSVNNQVQVSEYYFDLAAELATEEQKLGQTILNLIVS